jgi:nitrate reductase delta subunit
MIPGKTTLLKLLSLCLSYPDAALVGSLPEAREAIQGLPDSEAKDKLARFAAYLEEQPALALQEHYTAAFDLNPAASLNLTYHLMGDHEDRGRALAELHGLYLQAGYELAFNELPDYLPLVLEFLAQAPDSETDALLGRCLTALPAITAALRKNNSGYAVPLELLCDVFPQPEEERTDRPAATDPAKTLGPGQSAEGFLHKHRGD